jgi:anti-sigma factor RsiW
MSAGERPIGDDDLQAAIDGRLAPERRDAVEAYLAAHSGEAAKVTADREALGALRSRLAFKAEQPIPPRLRVAGLYAEHRRRMTRRLGAMAAAIALLVVGAGAGWLGHDLLRPAMRDGAGRPGTMTADAVAAFRTFVVESVHPVEVRADQEAHLVQWLSRRLGKPVLAPDLSGGGFRLIGGRLLPAGARVAAMFMYDDDRGTRLTLYSRPGESEEQAAFRFERQGDVSAFSWIERGLSYVVTARTDRERLLGIAELIERQMRGDGPRGEKPPGREL